MGSLYFTKRLLSLLLINSAKKECIVSTIQKLMHSQVIIAVFSRMRGNRILEKLTVQDCNTPHSCDYRYNVFVKLFFYKPS